VHGLEGSRILAIAGAGTIGTPVCVRLGAEGALVAIKHLVPALIDGGGGPLVHTSSAGAYLASPSMVAYAMA